MAKEVFPQKIGDRRLLPHTPTHLGNRRISDRFLASQEVVVNVCDKRGKKVCFLARLEDISSSGVAFKGMGLEMGQEYSLSFSLPPGVMPEGYESSVSLKARVVRFDPGKNVTALLFDKPLEKYFRVRRWRRFEALALLFVMVAIAAIFLIKMESVFYFWFDVPVFLYGLAAAAVLVTRFLFASLYKPTPVDPDFTPGVSIVVPCYNEQEFVARTIRLCLDQDYPEDRLEVIAVNDGSIDRTGEVLDSMVAPLEEVAKGRFHIVHFEKNLGKRQALRAGTLKARHDILVYVDSDSFLAPDAIRQLVQPLREERIAGVCGFCGVENKWTNFLTKMQAVHYFIMFRVFKAAESVFDSVTCLSGPLSAYRKHLVLEVMDAWVTQSIFGLPTTLADDRSLTNMLLKHHPLVYQHTAVCSTLAPSSYRHFFSQQMRWMRSWLLENIIAGLFMWRKEPFMALSFYLDLLLAALAPYIVIRAFILEPIFYDALPLIYMAGIALMATLMASAYMFVNRSALWVYGIPFSFFYLLMLVWMLPQAALTLFHKDWGARRASADPEAIQEGKA